MKGITVTGKNSLRLNNKMIDTALLYYVKEKILSSDYKYDKDSRWHIPMKLKETIRHRNGDITLNFTDEIKFALKKKIAPLAQWKEQANSSRKVEGSSPSGSA